MCTNWDYLSNTCNVYKPSVLQIIPFPPKNALVLAMCRRADGPDRPRYALGPVQRHRSGQRARGPGEAAFGLLGSLCAGLCLATISLLLVGPVSAQTSPNLAILTTSLPDGQAGQLYSATVTAAGGTPPYTWSVATGSIPGGLVLDSSGSLSGIPGSAGSQLITLRVTDAADVGLARKFAITIVAAPTMPQSLALASTEGDLIVFSNASPSTTGAHLAARPDSAQGSVVALAANNDGSGDWLVTTTGRVYVSGDALSFGSIARRRLIGHVVGIAAHASDGYWLVSDRGRIYDFGAVLRLGAPRLSKATGAVAAIAPAPGGFGYWVLTTRGRVFAFGQARNRGSAEKGQFVGIAPTPSGLGYWVVSSTGQVDGFGDAPDLGSVTSSRRGRIVAIAGAPTGLGYWVVSADGQIFSFGSALAFNALPGPAFAHTTIAASAAG